jgi:hypothetical protein
MLRKACLNRDPGAAPPSPFVSVVRVEDRKIAHWILITPQRSAVVPGRKLRSLREGGSAPRS